MRVIYLSYCVVSALIEYCEEVRNAQAPRFHNWDELVDEFRKANLCTATNDVIFAHIAFLTSNPCMLTNMSLFIFLLVCCAY